MAKRPRIIDPSQIPTYLEKGMPYKDWYKDCRDGIIRIFGEEDLWLVTAILATTSPRASLKSNIKKFRTAYVEYKNGLPFSEKFGSAKAQLECVARGEPLTGRKVDAFRRAMYGEPDPVVVDMWIMRAFGLSSEKAPTRRQYDEIEFYIRDVSRYVGLTPSEMQCAVWCGIRSIHAPNEQLEYLDFLNLMVAPTLFDEAGALQTLIGNQ